MPEKNQHRKSFSNIDRRTATNVRPEQPHSATVRFLSPVFFVTITVLLTFFLFLLLASNPVNSRPATGRFLSHFPVDCNLDANCWIIDLHDHRDHSESPASQSSLDYQCNSFATIDSRQTLISIGSSLAPEHTNDLPYVLAAAEGTVHRIIDRFPDDGTSSDPDGNIIQIRHANGYMSMYTYLQKDSILVEAGDSIISGQPLARVGASGRINEYALGFRIFDQPRNMIDPFAGGCNSSPGLWQIRQPDYPESFALVEVALLDDKPANRRQPSIDSTVADGRILHFFTNMRSVSADDQFQITLCPKILTSDSERQRESKLAACIKKQWHAEDSEGYIQFTKEIELSPTVAHIPGIFEFQFKRNGRSIHRQNITVWEP